MFRRLRRFRAEWRIDRLIEEAVQHGSAHCKGAEPCHYMTELRTRLRAAFDDLVKVPR